MRPSVFQTLCFSILAVVLAGSCSDTATAPGQLGDANEVLDAIGGAEIPQVPDAEPDVQEEPNYQTCDEAADCDSTWCVLTQNGSVCTEPCIENCPKGYKCKSTVSGGSDPISLCLPAYLSLCFPCTEDTDCSNIPGALIPYEGAKCISQGAKGGFCGGACDSDDACPTDFSCKEVQVGESDTNTTMQCVPDAGTCSCSPLAESLGATAQCYADNEMGRCFGGVTCKEGELTTCDAVPAFDEICDGLDNDCDEDTDEGLEAPVSTKQGGICLNSKQVCDGVNGWIDPNYAELTDFEATEVTCDGKDNDCDGTVDNGLEAPTSDIQLGVCAGAVKVCTGGAGWSEPNYGIIENYETNETICDGLDNDCDGQIDEDLTGDPDADNQNGVCAGSVKVCAGSDGWVEPDYTILDGYLADENNCDDLDNDCDGDTDEGFEPGGSVSFEDSDGAILGKSEACGVGQCAEGTVVCGEDKQSLTCSTLDQASDEVCDGIDNDCDPSTVDGAADPSLGADCDGEDVDLCKEGAFTCEGGALTCNDTEDPDPDLCDGVDNDCNPATADGFGDPDLGSLCDSDSDLDLCKEGKLVCLAGALTCDDAGDADPDLCDGQDNDCNTDTVDGSGDPNVGVSCDGEDSDLCKEADTTCVAGAIVCVDLEDDDIDICDGLDNDCNPITPDGFADPQLDDACDGEGDADLCKEGNLVCKAGSLNCNDPGNPNPDLCDGFDNDCNPATDDGSGQPSLGNACDGNDPDLCEDGTMMCTEGVMKCNDADDLGPDFCDGVDNDCNPATPDGFNDPQLGAACDGENDADLCKEGKLLCNAGALSCDDAGDADPDVCDGQDNDCNPDTVDGSGDPQLNTECDGSDADLCNEGKWVCSAGTLTCDDANDADPDVCDGVDNDCNPATPDGDNDPQLGDLCDGVGDADLCKEGKLICSAGALSCDDPGDADPDVCDGQDNDCNADTVDGSQDPQLNTDCDGNDADLCNEGKKFCNNGALDCNDPNDEDADICDGQDNDCNPATFDGSQDPQFNASCDGADKDLCAEGIFLCTNGALVCNDANDADPELCDGQDNDCDPSTLDGSEDPQLDAACDGNDADLCEEGKKVCIAGSLSCNDANDVNLETCDSLDNDCNPATVDGSQDPQLNLVCDGDDADLCKEGLLLCTGGSLSCSDLNDVDLEICDLTDNDCNPETVDGSGDPQLNAVCDGNDADLCNEGKKVCTAGSLTCDDPNDADPDICDGENNDCNPATADGSGDPQFGAACDGTDADACEEGNKVCTGGTLVCDDPNDVDLEVCDGQDNDCKASTVDGSQDPQLGVDCDGNDADLCNEGTRICTAGSLVCNDPNDVDLELCGGGDQDCNPATADGSQEPQLGAPCDGNDADLCKEGTRVCVSGSMICNDPNDVDLDLCGGGDQDCNPATADGSQHPQFGNACDGNDADLCNEGTRVCSGTNLICNDPNDVDLDLCGGGDQDCNPATVDGSGESQFGNACDGTDTDLCKEGTRVCSGTNLVCNDANDVDLDLCGGGDQDCNPATVDGSGESQFGVSCDGNDADLCNEGIKVCSGTSLVCNDPNDLDLELCGGGDQDCNPATADGSQEPQLGASC
ncbi:MAG TPA: hypothetical protein EYN66_21210, partial [Myxococcales bacterium]|nr:hypothetical protein [Myxococcales bacterium]